MQIAVGGCLAQMDGDRIRQRAAHVDVVFGTHNLSRAPELLRQAAADGPGGRDPGRAPAGHGPDAADQQAAALAAVRDLPYAAWVTIQTGLRQLVRLLHRPVGARAARCPVPSTIWWPRWRPWPPGG